MFRRQSNRGALTQLRRTSTCRDFLFRVRDLVGIPPLPSPPPVLPPRSWRSTDRASIGRIAVSIVAMRSCCVTVAVGGKHFPHIPIAALNFVGEVQLWDEHIPLSEFVNESANENATFTAVEVFSAPPSAQVPALSCSCGRQSGRQGRHHIGCPLSTQERTVRAQPRAFPAAPDLAFPTAPNLDAAIWPVSWADILSLRGPTVTLLPGRARAAVAQALQRALSTSPDEALKRFAAFGALVLRPARAQQVIARAHMFSREGIPLLIAEVRESAAALLQRAEVTATTRCLRLARVGFFSRAVAALKDERPATMSRETHEALLALHPGEALPEGLLAATPTDPITASEIRKGLFGFKRGSAPGPSGVAPDILRGAVLTQGSCVLEALVPVVNALHAATLSAECHSFFFGGTLLALPKKPSGIRPIGCGDVLRRLLAKALCIKHKAALGQLLLGHHQFGVGVPFGAEVVCHTFRRIFAVGDTSVVAIKIDLRNAFNCLSRKALLAAVGANFPALTQYSIQAYGRYSSLFCASNTRIESRSGVQQGDPLGPALFSIAIASALEGTQRAPAEAWYLDDGVLAGTKDQVFALTRSGNDCSPLGWR